MQRPTIVSRDEWTAARKRLLVKEKELNRQRDALSAERRKLPMVKIEKEYVFQGPEGRRTLADLFEGKRQLLVYHFMFGPDYDEGCPACSFVADNFAGSLVHLAARDTAFAVISRAPLDKIKRFKERMGWDFPWLSSFGTDFNHDFQVTLDDNPHRVQLRARLRPTRRQAARGREGRAERVPARRRPPVPHLLDLPARPRPVPEHVQLPRSHAARPSGRGRHHEMASPPRQVLKLKHNGVRAAGCHSDQGRADTAGTRRWKEVDHGFRASFPASVSRRLGAALRGQRGGDDRLVCVHVGDGRDADARRLDDVDGVDADARTDLARRGGVVPRHVGRDDGGDDAAVPGPDAVALSPGGWPDRRDAPRWADRAGGRGVLLRLDRVRNGRFSLGRRAGGDRDAASRRWRAPYRSRSAWSCCSRASSSSPPGRRVTSPAAAKRPVEGIRCRPTPARHGDTACASASTAAAVVLV